MSQTSYLMSARLRHISEGLVDENSCFKPMIGESCCIYQRSLLYPIILQKQYAGSCARQTPQEQDFEV